MSKTAFISGHLDLTEKEFKEHYIPRINSALRHGYDFVVGDAKGCDFMAQKYLKPLLETRSRVDGSSFYHGITVYHMFDKPRNCIKGFRTKGGFTSDEDRDSEMTTVSELDIAWVRKGRETSGTAKNIERRSISRDLYKDVASEYSHKIEKKANFYWRLELIPWRICRFFRKHFLRETDNRKIIQREVDKHRHELVFDSPFRVQQLIGWTDQFEEDYYYILWSREDGLSFQSCVGGFDWLKKRLSKKEYYNALRVWNYNCPTIQEILAKCRAMEIEVK